MSSDKRRQFAHCMNKQMSLRLELSELEKKLDEFEQMHLQFMKYGSLKNYDSKMIEEYENSGYLRTLERYKVVYNDLFRVERRICELTNNHRDFY